MEARAARSRCEYRGGKPLDSSILAGGVHCDRAPPGLTQACLCALLAGVERTLAHRWRAVFAYS